MPRLQVDADDGVPLLDESRDRRRADAAGGAGDERDPHDEPAQHVGDHRLEHPLTLGRGRARRVAEHPVGGHRRDAAGHHRGENLPQRLGVPDLGQVEPDRLRTQVQHQRGLGEAGVQVHRPRSRRAPTRPRRRPCRAARLPPWALTKTTRSAQVRSDRVSSTSDLRQRLGADRRGAGEGLVLAAGPVGQRRRDPGARQLRRHRRRATAIGDGGVGVERQVRAVLLDRADRHQHEPRRAGESSGAASASRPGWRAQVDHAGYGPGAS